MRRRDGSDGVERWDTAVDGALGGADNATDNVNYGDGHKVVAVGSGHTGNSTFIGGEILGTEPDVSGTDHFGFVAVQIGCIEVDGASVAIDQDGATQPVDVGTTGERWISTSSASRKWLGRLRPARRI